jgi:hypothetical protein
VIFCALRAFVVIFQHEDTKDGKREHEASAERALHRQGETWNLIKDIEANDLRSE